jgi:hypothetical protein
MGQFPFTNAGLFHWRSTGLLVACYTCGVNIQNWEKDMKPEVAHAINNQNCEFMKFLKGEEVINSKVKAWERAEQEKNRAEPEEEEKFEEPKDTDSEDEQEENSPKDDESTNMKCVVCLTREKCIVTLPC